MRRKITVVLVALAMVVGVVLLGTGTANATQSGLQQVMNTSDSASGFTVRFNACDWGVNPGQFAGEGRPIPQCGSKAGDAEPVYVWLGPGWCATRWIYDYYGPGQRYPNQNLAAGGSGHWFQLWQSWITGGADYTNFVKAWRGGACPTSGGAWVDNFPPGNIGQGAYEW